jgi:hypothetical protein
MLPTNVCQRARFHTRRFAEAKDLERMWPWPAVGCDSFVRPEGEVSETSADLSLTERLG